MSEPEKKSEAPKPKAKTRLTLTEVLAADRGAAGFLGAYKDDLVQGEITPDRWNWVYTKAEGGFSVLPDRSEALAPYARFYLEGNTLVAWEPL